MGGTTNLKTSVIISVFLIGINCTIAAGDVIYVDDDATGANENDGSSWANAYNYLQDALTVASSGDEIWVAEGTYKPDQGSGKTPGDREAMFSLFRGGVAIYGGFAGGETTLAERDWENNETILSGDLNGDDVGIDNIAENSYHLVYAHEVGETVILDGFTITAGNSNGAYQHDHGGGMFNNLSSPTLTNCTFSWNSADYGGGMYNYQSSPTVTNCTFSRNVIVNFGGGMYNYDSSPTLTNCEFRGNPVYDDGGGMYNTYYSNPTLTNCTFSWNRGYRGGGMYNQDHSKPTLTNCYFISNTGSYGGGMYNYDESNPTLNDCIFSENLVGRDGGGMYNDQSSPTVNKCSFGRNVAGYSGHGGGMYNRENSNPTLTNCTFTENAVYDDDGPGGGMYNYQSSPTVNKCTFFLNSALDGGGMYNDSGSPTMTNCTFSGNSAWRGGGMHNRDVSNPTVTNCTFSGNHADEGGGMYNYESSPTLTDCTFSGNSAGGLWPNDGGGTSNYESSPTLTNCTFSGNSADYGGGMAIYGGSATLTNCTFSGNSANFHGGGMYNGRGSSTVTNCIFWGNSANMEGPQIGGTAIVTYSDVQGGYSGAGNIDADPLFVDADGPDDHPGTEDDNLRLSAGSPCIDAANGDVAPTTDIVGTPRYDDPGTINTGTGSPDYADMGAYEWRPPPTTIYVDFFAPAGGNGSSWTDAYKYLRTALNAALTGDEIRVAQGLYTPTDGIPRSWRTRAATFKLKNAVAIYGGFPTGGGAWEDRDPQAYKTILSGDLNGADGPNFANNGENSYHVVYASYVNETAILDGFTITAGNANASWPDDSGGGMHNRYDSSPTLTNCTFRANTAHTGGGMYNYVGSSPTLTNCTFSDNSAQYGGGMSNDRSISPTVTNCIFSGNSAANNGGGMSNDQSSPTVTNCTFTGNSAVWSGGGMHNIRSCSPTLTNCTFSGNSAQEDGGGMYNSGSNPTVTNCTFSGNSADNGGGMLNWHQSSPTLTNCTFAGNSATNGNALACDSYGHPYPSSVQLANCILWDGGNEVWNNDGSTITLTYSDVQGGYIGTGNIDDDPLFVDADGPDGIIGTKDDNLRLLPGSPCIDAADGDVAPTTDIVGTPHYDDPGTINTGTGTPDYADIGAYEWRPPSITIYVDTGTTGNNDGSSWTAAFKYLQDALWVAWPGDEIWVAEGTYKPDEDEAGNVTPGDRTATFQLINTVAIYGGFPTGGGAWEDRDTQAYKTILSGDLSGNDVQGLDVSDLLDHPSRAENGYHVVTNSGTDEATVLNGFTITAGNAKGGSPDNRRGSGMYNKNCTATISNCTFSDNSAYNGGGMGNYYSSRPTLTNCAFSGNSARVNGGGMFNEWYSSPTLTNCTFSGNLAGSGGGMGNWGGSPMLINCTFSGNSAGDGGGMFNHACQPFVTNCTFSRNSANHGGGIYNQFSGLPIFNSILRGNTANFPLGSQIAATEHSFVNIIYCCVQLGGMYWDMTSFITSSNVTFADPLFVDADGPDNITGTADDNLRLSAGSPCIDAGNNGMVPAGVTTDLDGNPRFVNDLDTVDTGYGTPPIVDMGAYEF